MPSSCKDLSADTRRLIQVARVYAQGVTNCLAPGSWTLIAGPHSVVGSDKVRHRVVFCEVLKSDRESPRAIIDAVIEAARSIQIRFIAWTIVRRTEKPRRPAVAVILNCGHARIDELRSAIEAARGKAGAA